MRLLPRADVYLQDEMGIAFDPTLTGFGVPKTAVDSLWSRLQKITKSSMASVWLTGVMIAGLRAEHLAIALRPSVHSCAALSRARKHVDASPVLLDNLGIQTPKGSLLLRQLLTSCVGNSCWFTSPRTIRSPNRIEWLWRSFRRAVIHDHTRVTLPPLLEDADRWASTISAMEILRQIGSPFVDSLDLIEPRVLEHAA